jgi:CheY-like chemotaxis protein
VAEAANGQAALALLEAPAAQIDLILSDVVMPEMGGVALVHALRAQGSAVPVILLSGHPLDKVFAALKEQGVACFTKPPDLKQLAETIAQTLAARRPER